MFRAALADKSVRQVERTTAVTQGYQQKFLEQCIPVREHEVVDASIRFRVEDYGAYGCASLSEE